MIHLIKKIKIKKMSFKLLKKFQVYFLKYIKIKNIEIFQKNKFFRNFKKSSV